jgi:HEPN domain-containing protein
MKINEIAEWFWIADEDKRSAELIYKDNNLSNTLAYYHCCQAVEKYLKGYLISKNKSFAKDHNLVTFINKCIEFNSCFKDVISECERMAITYKGLRYPGRLIPTQADMNFAFELTNKVKQLRPIQELLDKIILEYGKDWINILFNSDNNLSKTNNKFE